MFKENQMVKVLLIEDDIAYFRYVDQLLAQESRAEFALSFAESLAEACQTLSAELPDVILLDLKLPDSMGLATFDRVKQISCGIPIVVVTGSEGEQLGLEAVAHGAQDYLIKQSVSDDSLVRCLLYTVERYRVEREMLRSTTIRDFTGTLAHDLSVPMSGGKLVLDAVLAGTFGDLPDELKRVLGGLRESIAKQLVLVQTLLEVYRYEVSPMDFEITDVDVAELIERLASGYSREESSAVPILLDIPPSDSFVRGNPQALGKLFESLIDNAVKFSDGEKPIEVTGALSGEKFVVQVHNSGMPIPEEVQENLFKNFWHGVPGKHYVPHTGLGLYRCHQIASLHHGRITCQSAAGRGTTLTVTLPVAAAP